MHLYKSYLPCSVGMYIQTLQWNQMRINNDHLKMKLGSCWRKSEIQNSVGIEHIHMYILYYYFSNVDQKSRIT